MRDAEKPQTNLEAQLASFAYESVENPADKLYILNNIGNIAAGDLVDITRVTSPGEVEVDEEGFVTPVPEGQTNTVATVDDYLSYLRSVKGSSYEGIQARSEMLDNYAEFAPAIGQLRGEVAELDAPDQHPDYIDEGAESAVFKITRYDKEYAVRVPQAEVHAGVVEDHVAGAALGNNIKGLEHVVAASYEDGVTVSELLPGQNLKDITPEDIEAVSDSQIEDFIDTIKAAHRKGIIIDFAIDNILYDREAGFSVIDYYSNRSAGSAREDYEVWEMVPYAGFALQRAAKQAFQNDEASYEAQINIMTKFRNSAAHKLEGEDLELALGQIDSELEVLQREYRDLT